MHCINRVELLGYLGRDPELAKNQAGMSICSLSLATSYDREGGDRVTEWSRVVMFKGLADNAARYLRKGTLVFVTGRLQTRSYLNREGQKVSVTEIIANDFIMFGKESASCEKNVTGETRQLLAECQELIRGDRCPADDEEMPF